MLRGTFAAQTCWQTCCQGDDKSETSNRCLHTLDTGRCRACCCAVRPLPDSALRLPCPNCPSPALRVSGNLACCCLTRRSSSHELFSKAPTGSKPGIGPEHTHKADLGRCKGQRPSRPCVCSSVPKALEIPHYRGLDNRVLLNSASTHACILSNSGDLITCRHLSCSSAGIVWRQSGCA